jgi:inorganic pyrophosphatase
MAADRERKPNASRGPAPSVDWDAWEATIRRHGVVIDRPKGSAHPRYPARIYPVAYGFVPSTIGGDGAEVDVFAGEAATGLVGVLLTHDAVKGDDELKLLWNVTEAEIDAITRFLFTGSMTGHLLRRPSCTRRPS